jgi:hypothetical protein
MEPDELKESLMDFARRHGFCYCVSSVPVVSEVRKVFLDGEYFIEVGVREVKFGFRYSYKRNCFSSAHCESWDRIRHIYMCEGTWEFIFNYFMSAASNVMNGVARDNH